MRRAPPMRLRTHWSGSAVRRTWLPRFLYLASAEADFVTGAELPVDGGLLIEAGIVNGQGEEITAWH